MCESSSVLLFRRASDLARCLSKAARVPQENPHEQPISVATSFEKVEPSLEEACPIRIEEEDEDLAPGLSGCTTSKNKKKERQYDKFTNSKSVLPGGQSTLS